MRDNGLGYILQRHATSCQKVDSVLHKLCAVGKHAWLPAMNSPTRQPSAALTTMTPPNHHKVQLCMHAWQPTAVGHVTVDL